jgi:hypothetical protein
VAGSFTTTLSGPLPDSYWSVTRWSALITPEPSPIVSAEKAQTVASSPPARSAAVSQAVVSSSGREGSGLSDVTSPLVRVVLMAVLLERRELESGAGAHRTSIPASTGRVIPVT